MHPRAGFRNDFSFAMVASDLLYATLAGASEPVSAQTIEAPRSVVGDNAAADSDTDLAKLIQNPIGDLISLPLQDNVNFGYGHRE